MERERERGTIYFSFTLSERQREKKRENTWRLSYGDEHWRFRRRLRGARRRAEQIDLRWAASRRDCDLLSLRWAASYGESATTTGELSYGDDDDWVFDFFRFGTESVLGFFFVFFGTESVLSLVYCFCFFFVCFDFALIVIFRLSQYLRIDFLCDLCNDVTVV